MEQATDSKKIVEVFKALSIPVRFEIIKVLLKSDCCVGALSKRLGVTEASVSQHLKVLRQAEIVIGDKRGYFTYYEINKKTLSYAAEAMNAIAQSEITRKGCRVHITGDYTCCERYRDKLSLKERTVEI